VALESPIATPPSIAYRRRWSPVALRLVVAVASVMMATVASAQTAKHWLVTWQASTNWPPNTQTLSFDDGSVTETVDSGFISQLSGTAHLVVDEFGQRVADVEVAGTFVETGDLFVSGPTWCGDPAVLVQLQRLQVLHAELRADVSTSGVREDFFISPSSRFDGDYITDPFFFDAFTPRGFLGEFDGPWAATLQSEVLEARSRCFDTSLQITPTKTGPTAATIARALGIYRGPGDIPAVADAAPGTHYHADVNVPYAEATIHWTVDIQALPVCSYSVSPTTAAFPFSGGSGLVTVDTQGGCPWTAHTNANWIRIVDEAGTAAGTVTYEVAPNDGRARTAQLIVAGREVTVFQQAAPCSLSMTPASASFGEQGGAGTFSIVTPAHCSWTATSTAGWISGGGSGKGRGQVAFSVDADRCDDPARAGSIVVTGDEQSGAFEISQAAGAACSFPAPPPPVCTLDGPLFIYGIEVTQAIQKFQTLAELKASGQPAIPIIAGKPAALRVYMGAPATVAAHAIADATGGDVLNQQKIAGLQPGCTAADQRTNSRRCQSTDFYFTPPPDAWTLTLDVTSDRCDVPKHSETFHFKSQSSRPLILEPVSICDGPSQCADAATLATLTPRLESLAPSPSVSIGTPSATIEVDTRNFNSLEGWWNTSIAQIDDQYPLHGTATADRDKQTRTIYYGMVRPEAAAQLDPRNQKHIDGKAAGIPAHGAGSLTTVDELKTDATSEVVAHEVMHTLGLRHTNTDAPPAVNGLAPGCFNFAVDPQTNWPPLANNSIGEVGYDVATHQPVLPGSAFDIMSYCEPRWISPLNYSKAAAALNVLTPVPDTVPAADATSFQGSGPLRIASGSITADGAVFDAMFETAGRPLADDPSGAYRIELQSATGAVLFSRRFTPLTAQAQTSSGDVAGTPRFHELVPVVDGGARIVLVGPASASLGSIDLGGAAPVGTFMTALAGMTMTGAQTIAWTIADADSTAFTTKVLYSADAGKRWAQIGQVSVDHLNVDFDRLPGANGTALLSILVSDGVHTGRTISAPFSVTKKSQVTGRISAPAPNTVFKLGDLVMLRAIAYDVDDGFLSGASVRWESNIDGVVGNGASFPAYQLHPGTHVITMTATDTDDNVAVDTVTIRVAGDPPTMTLTKTPFGDSNAPACMKVTLDPQTAADGVELESVQYSLDGGASWIDVALGDLPSSFTSDRSGAFHVVARAFDVAGQLASADLQFTTTGSCQSVDRIAPVTTMAMAPLPNARGWNTSNVTVALTADDNDGGTGVERIEYALAGAQSGSGVLRHGGALTIAAEGRTTVTCFAVDYAGNRETPRTLMVQIDKTAPTVTFAAAAPAPNAAGWNRTNVSVPFVVADLISGVESASASAPIVFSTDGAGLTASITVVDNAGNRATVRTPAINIDSTPPEAYAQFDAATQTIQVFGRDVLSGVADSPAVKTCDATVAIDGADGDDGNRRERCRFVVSDRAGNTVEVGADVRGTTADRDDRGGSAAFHIASVSYNGAAAASASFNEMRVEWSIDAAGAIESLQQTIAIGSTENPKKVRASFDRRLNQTVVRIEPPDAAPDSDSASTVVTKPGVHVLRIATQNGSLAIEF
jgi:BACON domain-containing protein/all-beta uncharacterized protein